MTPEADHYSFHGEGVLDPILAGILPSISQKVVTPAGYSEGWNTSLAFSIGGVALAA
jgi:hypothetical protein